MKSFLLYIKWLRWKWHLAQARAFRVSLEKTITYERVRAQHDVEHAELMERRAEMAMVAARADRQLELKRVER